MTITLNKSADVAAPTESGFDRTARILAAATAKLADLKARLDRVTVGRDANRAAAKDAREALANLAIRRADGEDVSASKATRLVADTEAEEGAGDRAVALLEADVAAAHVEFLKAERDHGVHAEAQLRMVIVDRVRALAKAGRALGSSIVDVQQSVNDLVQLQQANRVELFKLDPVLARGAPRFVCDETLQRVDRLVGAAIGGHLVHVVVENRPNSADLDAIAAREEAEAKRAVR